MRTVFLGLGGFLLIGAAACGNSPDPRLIKGGGVGDGAIDGLVNVYVIDNDTYAPIVDATVEIDNKDQQTDDTGLVIFQDVSGPQTVAVKACLLYTSDAADDLTRVDRGGRRSSKKK